MIASNVSIELVKAIFMESGQYHDMGLRPYTFTAGGNAHKQFLEATQGGVNLEPLTISSIANQILTPSPQRVQQTHIDNGWNSKRFMFMMRFRVYQDTLHGKHLRNEVVIQGMTSHLGVIRENDTLDPNMLVYINNITRLEPYQMPTPHGVKTSYRPVESSQVIRNEPVTQMGQTQGNRYTLRPQDVYGTMTLISMGADSHSFIDTRNTYTLDQSIMKSNRKNACSPYYLANITKSHRFSDPDYYTGLVSADTAGSIDDVDMHDAYAGARQRCMHIDGSTGTDLFFNALGENYRRMGYITMGELTALSPNLLDPSYTQVIMDSKGGVVKSSVLPTTDAVNYSNHWNGSNEETLWANVLVQSIPALMVDFLVTGCSFTVTNRTRYGMGAALQFIYAHPFVEEMDIVPLLPRLEERIICEIFNGLSMNNTKDFMVTMEINMSGDTRLGISIGGEPEQVYMAPSFCDSIYAPVSTFNRLDVDTLGNDMSGFINGIKNDTSYFNQYGPQNPPSYYR